MDTWVIVLIVVVVVVLLVVLALVHEQALAAWRSPGNGSRPGSTWRRRSCAAPGRSKEQALAEEQAARARRERAEVQERTALAEQEARDRAAGAVRNTAAAEELRAKADKLAPDLADDRHAHGEPRRRSTPGIPTEGSTRR